MDKRILVERNYYIVNDNGRTTPSYVETFLKEKFSSVVRVSFVNTSSSAGDWTGLIYQRLNGRLFVIPFYIENAYPYSGFDCYTSDKVAVFNTTNHSEVEKYIFNHFNLYETFMGL